MSATAAASSRGLSGFDVRHRLVVSSVFELPFGTGKAVMANAGPVVNKIVGGWEVSFIATAQGGFPYTAAMSGDVNGDGITDRPDLVGPVSYNPRNPQCYVIDSRNPACHASQQRIRQSAGGRAALRIGRARHADWSRPVPGRCERRQEHAVRQGRAVKSAVPLGSFNFFNRANYNSPAMVVNVASPAFGSITSAARAREMQFGMRLEF